MFHSRYLRPSPEAPTSLIAAHLALRDAMISAEAALQETTHEAAAGTRFRKRKNLGKKLWKGIKDDKI